MPRHKRDWKKYNKELVNRGNLNFWIPKKAYLFWMAKKGKKAGRPFTYSNEAIQTMLVVRFKYRLPLRELEGLFQFLAKWISIPKVPCYTQVCRRMRSLTIPRGLVDPRKVTDLIIDTTGLKIYGEGEWCAKRYGGRSKWVKLHVSLDPKSGKLTLAEVTKDSIHDTSYMEKALQTCNKRRGKVLFDGIADSKKCYKACKKYNKRLLTPPSRRAVLRSDLEYGLRNEALKVIKGLGGDKLARSIWGKLTGYSQRSEVESAISRWKRVLGGRLKSKSLEKIKKEVRIKAMIYNQMVDQMRSA